MPVLSFVVYDDNQTKKGLPMHNGLLQDLIKIMIKKSQIVNYNIALKNPQ
jgi:hypothetical protein